MMDATSNFQFNRLIVLASVMVALLLVPGWTHVNARQTTASVSVVRNEVTLDFPEGLNFKLELDSETVVSKADLLFSVGEIRTLIQTSARLADSPNGVIDHFVSMQTLGIPTGLTLSYHWRLQTQEGEVVDTPPMQADWFDDRYQWTTFSTSDVLLFAYGDEDQFYDQAAQVAQNAVTQLQQRFDAPARVEPLRIWLYESQSDMSGALSPNSREWIGGVSYSRYSLIAAVVPSGSEYAIQRAIPHEVAHQIIHDATQNPFIHPATWLDEGIAMAVQTVDLEGLDEMVEDAYQAGTLPTVQSMISEFGSDGGSTRLAYASSYSVVTFIEETMGPEMIVDLVSAYSDGLSHDQTLLSVLEIDTIELNRLWREHLENQING